MILRIAREKVGHRQGPIQNAPPLKRWGVCICDVDDAADYIWRGVCCHCRPGFIPYSARTNPPASDCPTTLPLNALPEVVAAGWKFLAPVGINNRGWIVGTGSHNGACCRSFVLM